MESLNFQMLKMIPQIDYFDVQNSIDYINAKTQFYQPSLDIQNVKFLQKIIKTVQIIKCLNIQQYKFISLKMISLFLIALAYSQIESGNYYNIYNNCGLATGCCIVAPKNKLNQFGGWLELGSCSTDEAYWLITKQGDTYSFKNKAYANRQMGVIQIGIFIFTTIQALPRLWLTNTKFYLAGDDLQGYTIRLKAKSKLFIYMNSTSKKNLLRSIDDRFSRFFFESI